MEKGKVFGEIYFYNFVIFGKGFSYWLLQSLIEIGTNKIKYFLKRTQQLRDQRLYVIEQVVRRYHSEAIGKYFVIASGSGCGSVGRAVVTDTRDPRSETSHSQTCRQASLPKRFNPDFTSLHLE